MDTVYILWHVRVNPDSDYDDEKLIGVYSSEEKAQEAKKRALPLPGFRDYPDCFQIAEARLDMDGWTEGFISGTEALRLAWGIEIRA